MAPIWNLYRNKIFRLFKFTKENIVTKEYSESTEVIPSFDKRYKFITRYCMDERYVEILDWTNSYCVGNVSINVNSKYFETFDLYIAFENEDDFLMFKIKYGT